MNLTIFGRDNKVDIYPVNNEHQLLSLYSCLVPESGLSRFPDLCHWIADPSSLHPDHGRIDTFTLLPLSPSFAISPYRLSASLSHRNDICCRSFAKMGRFSPFMLKIRLEGWVVELVLFYFTYC
jgi:hypothetical protein